MAADGRRHRISSFRPRLKGLEPFKDKLIVITGLFSDQAEPLGDGGGDHSRACGSYLTGVHVKKSDSIVENAISMDQIAAKAFERETQLSSLQMTADENSLLGSCDLGYSCAYSSTRLLADADAAADGREQPARAFRADVRRQR